MPQQVGARLNVEAVLAGRVAQRGDTLSISVELIEVRSNRQLSGGRFNRRAADILLVQEEISRQISDALRLQLTGEQKQLLASLPRLRPGTPVVHCPIDRALLTNPSGYSHDSLDRGGSPAHIHLTPRVRPPPIPTFSSATRYRRRSRS